MLKTITVTCNISLADALANGKSVYGSVDVSLDDASIALLDAKGKDKILTAGPDAKVQLNVKEATLTEAIAELNK